MTGLGWTSCWHVIRLSLSLKLSLIMTFWPQPGAQVNEEDATVVSLSDAISPKGYHGRIRRLSLSTLVIVCSYRVHPES